MDWRHGRPHRSSQTVPFWIDAKEQQPSPAVSARAIGEQRQDFLFYFIFLMAWIQVSDWIDQVNSGNTRYVRVGLWCEVVVRAETHDMMLWLACGVAAEQGR